MPQSFSRVLTHLVFSTKDREPVIHAGIWTELHSYLVGILSHINCRPLQVGGVEDHVHLFFGLSRAFFVSQSDAGRVIEYIKKPRRASSEDDVSG